VEVRCGSRGKVGKNEEKIITFGGLIPASSGGDMENICDYRRLCNNFEQKIMQKHHDEIKVCQYGIELVNYILDKLEGLDYDYSTPELATRSLLWRYYSSIPSTAYCCLSTGIQGHNRISFSIFRILIEETVSIKYYSQDYNRAYDITRNLLKSGKPVEPKFSTKLNKIDSESKQSLSNLYDAISEAASHSNALKFPGELISQSEDTLKKLNEPKYEISSIKWIINGILRQLLTILRIASVVYPELENDNLYKRISNGFFDKSLNYLSSEGEMNI
jgi:hypothetical protein